MRPALRLLILGGAGGRVHELRVTRAALWLSLIVPAALTAVLLAGAYLLATRPSPPSPARSPTAPLTQKLERPASTSKEPQQDPNALCPPGMLLVEGDYCPEVRQRCERYLDPEGSVLRPLRCAQYTQPSECTSATRTPLRYCIDRDEYAEDARSPAQNQQTFAQAQATCEKHGKRLCSEPEWTFACEGEAMQPYPYGFSRDPSRCNIDRAGLVTESGELNDLRAVAGAHEGCESPFGVRQLSGNVEEYVHAETGGALRKGAYWQPGANHCRASQPHDDPNYSGVETGFRCCAEARGEGEPERRSRERSAAPRARPGSAPQSSTASR